MGSAYSDTAQKKTLGRNRKSFNFGLTKAKEDYS